MKTANIVLGLQYGDEGKGITTDYLCSKSKKPIVIRFSGGQQAGHTVIHNGIKHTFSNFGAGSLRGVPTYWSEHTCFYPTTIIRELKILKEKGVTPKLILHPLAKMTTPFDVFANRFDPTNMGDGSCGLGIGKTMKRNESPFKLYAVDLLNKEVLFDKLKSIKEIYYNNIFDDSYIPYFNEYMDFLEAIKELDFTIAHYSHLLHYDSLVFEGSQGIMLDMDHGVFPHVTYASTTSKNAVEILNQIGVTNYDVFYVTRCYSTRHGNGPFVEKELNLINNEEEINVLNEYQGRFKTGELDYSKLNYALAIDKIYTHGDVCKHLVVTCLDQLPDFIFDYSKIKFKMADYIESYSPDNKDFIVVNKNILKYY